VVRTCVPDLRLYPLIVYRDYASGELDTDRRPALEIELVAYEPREHCGDKVSAAALHPTPIPDCIRTVSTWSER
jgi:hypothetical protein